MGRPRILTESQWLEIERRRKLARDHCDKKIAADYGLTVNSMQQAIRHYRKAGLGGKIRKPNHTERG